MTEKNKYIPKKSLERIELSNKPTVIITEKLQNQIKWLHAKNGSTEWSGELITREEGMITDLDSWKIYAEDIFLADIGTSVFTGYEVDKGSFKAVDIIDLYDKFPGLLDGTQKAQHIHTHYSMKAFFSQTDWENLEDRACLSNYFLMLIVNFDGTYCAKVAYKTLRDVPEETILPFANNSDGYTALKLNKKASKEALVVMDCKIEWEKAEVFVDSSFSERYERVKKDLEEEKKANTQFYKPKEYKQGSLEKQWLGIDDGGMAWDDDDTFWKPSIIGKEKGLLEMSDKEWDKFQKKDIFNQKEANALVNSIILDSTKVDTKSPIAELTKISRTLKTTAAIREWAEEFFLKLEDSFKLMFPQAGDDDYVFMLEKIGTTLDQFKLIPLIKEIAEGIDFELAYYYKNS